jgi:hypothetical protein
MTREVTYCWLSEVLMTYEFTYCWLLFAIIVQYGRLLCLTKYYNIALDEVCLKFCNILKWSAV